MKRLIPLLLAVILILPACTTQKGGENMANMLYNGVELPDINTVWTDKETYPYAYMFYLLPEYAEQYYGVTKMYYLHLSQYPYTWDGTRFSNSQAPCLIKGYLSTDGGAWEQTDDTTVDAVGNMGKPANDATVYSWCNTDLVNADGTVYLAASDPVPVGGSKLTISTGGSANGDGMALYNGVMLPKLPEWDKTAYPYAYLFYQDLSSVDEGAYLLQLMTTPQSVAIGAVTTGEMKFPSPYILGTLTNSQVVCDMYAEYGLAELSVNKWDMFEELIPTSLTPNVLPTWANCDVLYADGTTYLAASDPIPLDGMNVITWDGDTTGKEVSAGGYVKVADYVPTDSAFVCIAAGGEVAVIDGFDKILVPFDAWCLSIEGTFFAISTSEDLTGTSYATVPTGTWVMDLGIEGATYHIAYPASSGGVTETTATVNFSCKDLLSTEKVYHIKAWCYPKGMDYWTAPATWESEMFAGTTHSESVTFTNLLPGTEYEVYAVIYGTEGATEHNATANFTTLGNAEGTVNAVILCNQVTGTSFTAWLFAQGLDSNTEYTAEFVVYRNDATGVFEDVLTFTGSENIQYSEFKGLRPDTEYIASVYLYPTGGEVIYFGECPVTTLYEEITIDPNSFPMGFASGLSGMPVTTAKADHNRWMQGYIVGDAFRRML